MRREFEKNQRRRENYHLGQIRISIDGNDQLLDFSELKTLSKVFQVPSEAGYLEVYGEDAEGSLLIAVIPLRQLDFTDCEEILLPIEVGGKEHFSFSIKHPTEEGADFSIEVRSNQPSNIEVVSQEPLSPNSLVTPGKLSSKAIYQHYQKPPVAQSSLFRRLLWFCAGVESPIIEHPYCVTERNKYAILGMYALISFILSATAVGSTLYHVMGRLPAFSSRTVFVWPFVVLISPRNTHLSLPTVAKYFLRTHPADFGGCLRRAHGHSF